MSWRFQIKLNLIMGGKKKKAGGKKKKGGGELTLTKRRA